MTRRFLILLAFFTFLSHICYAQITAKDDRLHKIVGLFGQAEVTIPYTDYRTLDFISREVSILNVINKQVHISLSPLTIEWFILQKFDYMIIDRTEIKGVITSQNLKQAMDWESYPSYTQYDSIMQSFSTLYPDLCQLDTIGTSINGKLVLALKISDNASIDEDEPEAFYSSSIHGDETGGFVLMLHLADYLLKNYNLDDRVQNIVDNLEIWINPLANPDGTYNTGNIIVSPTRFNANGYDLNRNFPDPFTPNTIKQKETLDMIKFMRKHRFIISANFHSGAEVVNYPWDRWLSKLHADNSWFNNISRAYADTVHNYSGPGYMSDEDNGVTRGAAWYIIYGGRQDFVTYELQGREVTIEIDSDYTTPAAQLALIWQYNWHSLIGYLENALYGIHGLIRNVLTEEPLPARVFIKGYDTDSSHVFSDTLSGRFIRLLEPGSWNLTFSAKGYYDTTLSFINVFDRQRTDIVVNMVPIINEIDTTIKHEPLLYPNPAKDKIWALLPEGIIGSVTVRIINQSGMLMSEYNTETIFGIPLLIDLKGLSGGTYTVIFTNTVTKTFYRARIIVIK